MSRRKVQIIREYETNNDDSPQETTITTQTSSKSSGGRISSEKPLKPMKIDIVRENRSNNEVVKAQQPPASFGDMQAKMEAEMESRRLDWEKEVNPHCVKSINQSITFTNMFYKRVKLLILISIETSSSPQIICRCCKVEEAKGNGDIFSVWFISHFFKEIKPRTIHSIATVKVS